MSYRHLEGTFLTGFDFTQHAHLQTSNSLGASAFFVGRHASSRRTRTVQLLNELTLAVRLASPQPLPTGCSSSIPVTGLAHQHWGGNPRPFFAANTLGSEFDFFFENSDLLKLSRKQVDKTVFFNDSNCYWQSMCSGEIVHRASFLTGECVFEAASGGR